MSHGGLRTARLFVLVAELTDFANAVDVSVESEFGKGTAMRFKLPAIQ